MLLFAGTMGAAIGHTLITVIVGPLRLRAPALRLGLLARDGPRAAADPPQPGPSARRLASPALRRPRPERRLRRLPATSRSAITRAARRAGSMARASSRSWRSAASTISLSIGLAFALRDSRAFCKYLCPSGAILRLTSRPALAKMAPGGRRLRRLRRLLARLPDGHRGGRVRERRPARDVGRVHPLPALRPRLPDGHAAPDARVRRRGPHLVHGAEAAASGCRDRERPQPSRRTRKERRTLSLITRIIPGLAARRAGPRRERRTRRLPRLGRSSTPPCSLAAPRPRPARRRRRRRRPALHAARALRPSPCGSRPSPAAPSRRR